jgi:hypothetical protein
MILTLICFPNLLLQCNGCRRNLVQGEAEDRSPAASFLRVKNFAGALFKPTDQVLQLAKLCERILRELSQQQLQRSRKFQVWDATFLMRLSVTLLHRASTTQLLHRFWCSCHSLDEQNYSLAQKFGLSYFEIRLKYMAKRLNYERWSGFSRMQMNLMKFNLLLLLLLMD